MLRSEGPCRTLLQQGLNQLGLQYSDFQAERVGPPIIQHHRADAFGACSHETIPSVDFEREVRVFVDIAAWL